MSRANTIQTNFTAGEVSPRMYGRVDVNKYFNGARKLRNMVVAPQGGVYRRPGTLYRAASKDSSKLSVLRPFKFSETQNYVLEFGNLYVRFYYQGAQLLRTTTETSAWLTATSYVVGNFVKESGIIYYCLVAHTSGTFATDLAAAKWVAQAIYEVPTPYLEADLRKLRFAQSADVMYIACRGYAPRTLSRTSHLVWALAEFVSIDGPYLSEAHDETSPKLTVTPLSDVATLTFSTAITITPDTTKVISNVTAHSNGKVKITTSTAHGFTTGNTAVIAGVILLGPNFSGYVNGSWVITVIDTTSFYLNSLVFDTRYTYFSQFSDNPAASSLSATFGFIEYRVDNSWKLAKILQVVSTTVLLVDVVDYVLDYDSTILTGAGTSSPSVFAAGDVGKIYRSSAGVWYNITSFTNSTSVGVSVISPLTTYDSNTITALLTNRSRVASVKSNLSVFASTDVGRLIRLSFLAEWVYGTINVYVDAKNVQVNLENSVPVDPQHARVTSITDESLVLYSCAGVATDHKLGAWSVTSGYPECVAFHQGRLGWGTTTQEPTTLWLSESGDFVGYAPSDPENSEVTDASAITITLVSAQVNIIKWMQSGPVLLVGTEGAEWQIKPSSITQTLTPTNISATVQTAYGSVATDQAIRIGSQVIFTQRSGMKIREMSYDFNIDAFVSKDLSIISEHIARLHGGIIESALQTSPFNVLWLVLGDGLVAGVTYEREHEVVGWHLHQLGGAGIVESVAVVESTDGKADDVYFQVKRTWAAGTLRYIEQLSRISDTLASGCWVDCAKQVDLGTPADYASFTGMSYLYLQTLQRTVDGVYVGDFTVGAGSFVTVGYYGTKFTTGLGYEAIVGVLEYEGGSQAGSSQGKAKRINEVTARVENSVHFKVASGAGRTDIRMTLSGVDEPSVIDRKRIIPGPVINVPGTGILPTSETLRLESGDLTFAIDDSYSDGGIFDLVQDEPYPINISALMPKLNTNE